MDQEIEISTLAPRHRGASSVGVLLGSFDPLHRGHQWIAAELLHRFQLVLLLLPRQHFEKHIRPPQNATLAQRVDLLTRIYPPSGRVHLGQTREVLFVRLATRLREVFPRADVGFGMGMDTYSKLLASELYFSRMGLSWGQAEEEELDAVRRHTIVFGRGQRSPTGVLSAPAHLRDISSTGVRNLAAALHAKKAPWEEWRRILRPLLHEKAARFIYQHGLYAPSPAPQG